MEGPKQERLPFFKRLKKHLTYRYKLILLDESTFHEEFSFRLKLKNLLLLLGVLSILLIGLTILLMVYTPLGEYVTGNSIPEMRRRAAALERQLDSLDQKMTYNEIYLSGIRNALTGETQIEEAVNRKRLDSLARLAQANLSPSPNDLAFRDQIEEADRFVVNDSPANVKGVLALYPPVKSGYISSPYDPQKNHFATDLSVETGTPVFSVYKGTVIYKDWSPEVGNVLVIEHTDNLISIYKHLSSTTVNTGDIVDTGDLVALAGNAGELSTGSHLHFELWVSGKAVNAEDYINFSDK